MPIPKPPRVVVTGAASGLGRAFCVELARHREGARFVAGDIDERGLAETAKLLGGAEFHAVKCDVANADDVGRLATLADEKLGGADLLINNAGVATSGLVGDVSLEDWRWIVGINLMGVVHGCHHFVPRFKAQKSGVILNVASAAGLISAPNMAPYNATKAGVVALSEAMSAELAGTGVSVTVLCPTFFQTNIGKGARGMTAKSQEVLDRLMARGSLQADGVARFALERADAGALYAVPHADGRWMWRLKRASPGAYDRILGVIGKRAFTR
jgi:NAD(P)-dependent dehydrogenase (short-subunit alcohol dehydrogenase family)